MKQEQNAVDEDFMGKREEQLCSLVKQLKSEPETWLISEKMYRLLLVSWHMPRWPRRRLKKRQMRGYYAHCRQVKERWMTLKVLSARKDG